MKWKFIYNVVLRVVAILCAGSSLASVASAQDRPSRTEQIEWTWEVRPAHADPKLPNVLLLGDSITRNYYPEVGRQLVGVANVYLMATSASIGDPRLLRQMADYSTAQPVHFTVVHFNNGMHGWGYSEADYRVAFSAFLAELRAIAPKAALIWATTTPVKKEVEPGPTNARIDARNRIAYSVIRSQGIAVDDQHGLMSKHSDLYQDSVHFDEQGAAIQGDQAAKMIRELMAKSRR
jgi:GDSL-like Lipase/Acylhydrolase family